MYTLPLLTLLVVLFGLSQAQAPGDESCTIDPYPDTEKNLMDSRNYIYLLPGNGTGRNIQAGAVWNDYSYDRNDEIQIFTGTFWRHGVAGNCRRTADVCGFDRSGTAQNNWLFTQHISKSFDSNTYNYPVTIHVNVTYRMTGCRDDRQPPCTQGFTLFFYLTNSVQLPSLEGNGYMNRNNYYQNVIDYPYAPKNGENYVNIYNFTVPSSSTGFYVAVRDNGTCTSIRRLRVYRDNCKPRQDGLVLYPDAPAPVSDKAMVRFSCVDNAGYNGTGLIECSSQGVWGGSPPKCGCQPGYQIDTTTREQCKICPPGTYQPYISDSHPCEPCPAQSETYVSGTGVCPCISDLYTRHPDRPYDPCIRAPSAPIFDLTKPPELQGTKITAFWEEPLNIGGDPSGLYYDVYAAQLVRGENPTFSRVNQEPVDNGCADDGSECRYEIGSLNSNTPYAILVVSANNATDDPEEIANITVLGSRYLIMVVGTEDAIVEESVSAGAAAGISFVVTLFITAAATALIVLLIVYLFIKRRSGGSYSGHHGYKESSSSTSTTTTTALTSYDEKPSTFSVQQTTNTSTVAVTRTSKPQPPPLRPTQTSPSRPGRPGPPPPRPHVPQRPAPPTRPQVPQEYNGY